MTTSKRLTFDPGIVLQHNAVWTSRTSTMATLNYMLLAAIKEGEESVWDNIETGPACPNGQPIGLNGQQTNRNGQHTGLNGQPTGMKGQGSTTDWSERSTNRSIPTDGQSADPNGQSTGQSSSGTPAIKVERNYRTRLKANDVRLTSDITCMY
jgi:hypothetical protein